MVTLPYKNSGQGKKGQVEEMFDNISSKYDLLNHLLSANIDKIWRKNAIKKLQVFNPHRILDVATGTGDFAIAASMLPDVSIVGVDISSGMLKVGNDKISKKGLTSRIELVKADSENLPFEDSYFDAVTVGFGVRNFENLEIGLKEILRVIKPGGNLMVLEFSKPQQFPFKQIYQFYFSKILPFVGRNISKDARAYTYLPESVNEFPDGKEFLSILNGVGFENSISFRQTFGVATIYQAAKPKFIQEKEQ